MTDYFFDEENSEYNYDESEIINTDSEDDEAEEEVDELTRGPM